MKPGDELILRFKDGDSSEVSRMLERNKALLERNKGESSQTALNRWVEAHGLVDHHYQAVKIMTGPVMVVESVSRDVRSSPVNARMEVIPKALPAQVKSSKDTVLGRAKRLIFVKGWKETTEKRTKK